MINNVIATRCYVIIKKRTDYTMSYRRADAAGTLSHHPHSSATLIPSAAGSQSSSIRPDMFPLGQNIARPNRRNKP